MNIIEALKAIWDELNTITNAQNVLEKILNFAKNWTAICDLLENKWDFPMLFTWIFSFIYATVDTFYFLLIIPIGMLFWRFINRE